MNTVHDIVKKYSTTYHAVLTAIKKLDIRGRTVRGTRVWSDAEVEAIGNALGKNG